MSVKKFRWSDILIIVILLVAFGYFYSRFNLDEPETIDTEAASTH